MKKGGGGGRLGLSYMTKGASKAKRSTAGVGGGGGGGCGGGGGGVWVVKHTLEMCCATSKGCSQWEKEGRGLFALLPAKKNDNLNLFHCCLFTWFIHRRPTHRSVDMVSRMNEQPLLPLMVSRWC